MTSELRVPPNPQFQDGSQRTSIEQPYRWGKVQSWLFMIGGSSGFVTSTALCFVNKVEPLRLALYLSMIVYIVCIAAGFGLLKKKMYGLVLFDIYSVYWCAIILIKYLRFEYSTLQMALGVATTTVMAAYMNKRWREFK